MCRESCCRTENKLTVGQMWQSNLSFWSEFSTFENPTWSLASYDGSAVRTSLTHTFIPKKAKCKYRSTEFCESHLFHYSSQKPFRSDWTSKNWCAKLNTNFKYVKLWHSFDGFAIEMSLSHLIFMKITLQITEGDRYRGDG